MLKNHDEANARRLDVGLVGDSFHFEADEVVGNEDAPNLLADSRGRLATKWLLRGVEHLGFDLTVTELDLPPLVVQLSNLGSRVRLGIG